MDEKDLKSLQDGTAANATAIAELKAQNEEVLKALKAPALPLPAGTTITGGDERAAERPFKSLADNLHAARNWAVNHELPTAYKQYEAGVIKAIKATGLNEGVASEGGVLVQTDFVNDLLTPMHEAGPFSSRVRNIPVSSGANGLVINAVNETSRATGSRWGGIQGYRLAEGGTKLPSKPDFRRMELRLKKYAVVCYATDELLQDAAALQSVISQAASEELNFMANDDILNGLGVAGPLGVLNSAALVTVAAEAGQAADTVINANLGKMWQRLHPRHRANAAWYINSEVEPQLDNLYIPAGASALEPRFVNYSPAGTMTIKGRPVIVNEFSAALGDVGDILLADMGDYITADKGGVQAAQSMHVAFLTDETVFRFVYRIDGQPQMNSAITPYKGTLTQSAYVALAAR